MWMKMEIHNPYLHGIGMMHKRYGDITPQIDDLQMQQMIEGVMNIKYEVRI